MSKCRPDRVIQFSLLLILSACTGGKTPSKSISVTMTDFAFVPNAFTVPAREQISIAVQNNGAVGHSLLIMQLGHEVHGHFTAADEQNVFWEQTQIGAGQRLQTTFVAPAEPGTYQIICSIAGHLEAGMVAKLLVVQQP